MRVRARNPFTTIRTEGGLLPPELLQRVAEGDKALGGLAPTNYDLAPTERLNEAISRSWNRLVGLWASFAPQLDEISGDEPGAGATRDRWLIPLFQELDFGRIAVARGIEVGGRSYPISHKHEETPIHLVGAGTDLDKRTPGVAGAARTSPHSLVQEYLNRTGALWGIASNGRVLRLLRDNVSLTRQAFLEFDLETMFSGEVYSDFAVLWLTCHASRFTADRPEECWLEKWSEEAGKQGTRALDALRHGVEQAIDALGTGFLAHPSNGALRDALREGTLGAQEYYRQLLRLVYRLIFLFVAEDRELLHPPETSAEMRQRYQDYYSTGRLRSLAERRRGTKHADLYRGMTLVMDKLGQDDGCPELGLPFMGGFLFSGEACPDLERADIANSDLMTAVRALAFTEDRKVLRVVDYRNIGAEELGSVYESLLELHPELHIDSASFALTSAAGSERKTTGSYYTPSSLVAALLDSTLNPVLEDAARRSDPEAATLALKVCDPATGSGHFLVAAAHRIAKRLAWVRTGDEEPAPETYRTALRDVISRCIFGIDVNPMAVELCKVSLWMEAMDPGRPLSFLDHHIVCGNSLLGATPRLIAEGIPDDAFQPLEGDDKKVVTADRKRNRDERKKGQAVLSLGPSLTDLARPLTERVQAIEALSSDTASSLRKQEQLWRGLETSDTAAHAKLIADAWCAAFLIQKAQGTPVLTDGVLQLLASDPHGGDPALHMEIHRLADQYRFLHPHLAFPGIFRVPKPDEDPEDREAGWSGGFDLIIGNPPWSRVKLQEKRFFSESAPEIANAPNKAARSRLLKKLQDDDPGLWASYQAELRRYEAESHFFHESGRFPLTGRGDVNTYALFAEGSRQLLGEAGRSGLVVQTGIATDDTTKVFFDDLVSRRSLVALFGFENEDKLFPAVHNQTKFCILVAAAPGSAPPQIQLSFGNRQVADVPNHEFTLTAADIARVNPNTRTCPVFRSEDDAEIVKGVHERVPILIKEGPPAHNPWGVEFQRMFDMTNDSHLFRAANELEADGWKRLGVVYSNGTTNCLPLLEGKMIGIYNPREGTYEGQTQAQANKRVLPDTPLEVLRDARGVNVPCYWVQEELIVGAWSGGMDWAIGFRDVAPKERTLVGCAVPKTAYGNQLPLIHLSGPGREVAPCLIATLSSFLVDYLVRARTDKGHMNYFIVKQVPIPEPSFFREPCPWDTGTSIRDWVTPRVVELTYTAWQLEAFGREFGFDVPYRWDPGRRDLLRAELDAAVFQLYELSSEQVSFVLDTFELVRDSDEKSHSEYRTKRLILERYEAIAKATDTGEPYETALDPPPADPRLAHDSSELMNEARLS